MNVTLVRRVAIHLKPQLPARMDQLGVEVPPLAHPQVRQKTRFAELPYLRLGLFLPHRLKRLPKRQVIAKVRSLVIPLSVLLVSLLLRLLGSFPRVLNRESAHNHYNFFQRPKSRRLNHDSRKSRVDR